MIKVKHLMDACEGDDGQRIWVEPIGLCADLREWCKVDHVMCHLGPPKHVWNWFQNHPDGYEFFRARYHEALESSAYRDALRNLAKAAVSENFTLLHSGEDANHNSAVALHEFLSELEAWMKD